MIMKGRAPLHLPGAGLLCVALLGAASLPAWAASGQQPPPTPQAPAVPVVQSEQSNPPPPPPKPATASVPVKGVRQGTPPAPPPPPPKVVAPREHMLVSVRARTAESLPADGRQLVDQFDADRTAIEREADQKVEALRADIVKKLEGLQQEYAKAGKLDEAVAIRDFLRSGLPRTGRYTIRYQGKEARGAPPLNSPGGRTRMDLIGS